MRTSHSSTNTTPYRAVTAERTTWTTCNWYTGGATMRTMRGPGTGRQRLEPDDEQSSRPVLRGWVSATRPGYPTHRHAAPARQASGKRIVDRRAGSEAGEDRDCRGGRAPALAHLERQGPECSAHHRTDPHGHACLQGRGRPSHDGRAIPQAVARVARGRRLSQQPEHLARQLRQTISYRLACRNLDDRRYGELPCQSAHEQVATDAMVSTRGRPAAAGPVCGLQRRARFRVR